MNNEKNNLGVNNNGLPAMGTVVNNDTVDKFNLPPISSFTNFDNNLVNNNVNDTNVSVFDLMNEFDGENTSSIGNEPNNQNVVNNVIGTNDGLDVFNSIPNQNMENINKSVTNIPTVENINSQLTFNAVNAQPQPQSINTIPTVENPNSSLTFNAVNAQPQPQSINTIPTEENPNSPLTFNAVNTQFQSQPVDNNPIVTNSNLDSIQNNSIIQNPINNNIPIEEQINSIAANVLGEANLNNQSTGNESVNNESLEVLKKSKKEQKQEKIKKEKNPKKNRKILLIIILIVCLIIIGVSIVLSYFMFFKKDKLVCEYQDYSSEDFLFSEVVTINFKGRQMSDAKFVETLTFTESGLEKKDIYQTDLQNQFEGMGFDVTYTDTVDEIEVTMDFTKENLENWTGTEIKSATKENLLREMKNAGYTCK